MFFSWELNIPKLLVVEEVGGANFPFLVNQANFLPGYEVITMIIVLVTTKEISLGTDFNQENWMLVILLVSCGCIIY